jgi:hypothetical protein
MAWKVDLNHWKLQTPLTPRTSIGMDNDKKRAFTKEDLDRKGMEYDVPDEIEILPNNHEISFLPDSFDSILLEVGTQGTQGTVLGGKGEVIEEKAGDQNDNEIQDTEDIIKPENSPTVPVCK